MEKVIPILPCSDKSALIDFYESLGFELMGKYPRTYLVFRREDLELHFYGAKSLAPQNNSSMCIVQTNHLEELYQTFVQRVKAQTGKVPRSGFPRISKIRDLSEDQRFTLADTSGNTLYFVRQKTKGSGTFFRDISNQKYAKKFAVLYDLVYSKEDLRLAGNLLPKLMAVKDSLEDLDKAKLLLLDLEINKKAATPPDIAELELLLSKKEAVGDWQKVAERFSEISQELK